MRDYFLKSSQDLFFGLYYYYYLYSCVSPALSVDGFSDSAVWNMMMALGIMLNVHLIGTERRERVGNVWFWWRCVEWWC